MDWAHDGDPCWKVSNAFQAGGCPKNLLDFRFKEVVSDPDTKVVVLTGTDPYYCAGVNLSATIQPMHPKKLHNMIFTRSLIEWHLSMCGNSKWSLWNSNRAVFDQFLDCPKPIIIGANGPAIGACVTSATLCDAIVASEQATFLTPFARLPIVKTIKATQVISRSLDVHVIFVQAGSSSRGMQLCSLCPDHGWGKRWKDAWEGGMEADCPRGQGGWACQRGRPTWQAVGQVGATKEKVKCSSIILRCQALGEEWVKAGKTREIPGGGSVEEYKEVNRKESLDLADAFLSTK